MLEGAIIGAVAGLIVTLVMFAKRGSTRKKVLEAFSSGGAQAARAVLDKRVRPVTKVSTGAFLNQRERMCALSLIGESETAMGELEQHTGSLAVVTQVGVIGWLGVAVRAEDPSQAAARVEQLATKLETEGGRMLSLVKKKSRALASLAAALSGGELDADTRRTIDSVANDGGFVQLLIWQALRRALAAAGKAEQSATYATRVRSITSAFE